MIETKQIKKMARTYSDLQIAHKGHPKGDNNGWTNGYIYLAEPLPTHTASWAQARDLREYADAIENATRKERVYPVLLQETYTTPPYQLHFCNANNETIIVDARYVSAVLKRAGKSAQSLNWHWIHTDTITCLTAELCGQCIAAIAPLDHKSIGYRWEWQLINRDIPDLNPRPHLVDWSETYGKATQPALL